MVLVERMYPTAFGTNFECVSRTLDIINMSNEEAEYLYSGQSNVTIGSASLLEGLPEEIVSEITLLGGAVEVDKFLFTDTNEESTKVCVFNHANDLIYES